MDGATPSGELIAYGRAHVARFKVRKPVDLPRAAAAAMGMLRKRRCGEDCRSPPHGCQRDRVRGRSCNPRRARPRMTWWAVRDEEDRAMPQKFDPATLASLRSTREVRIRTARNKSRSVVIWIVVAEHAAFVRSVRGPAGKWFAAAAADGTAMLELDGRQMPVRVIPVADQATIEAVSQAFLTKYATSPYAQSIIAPDTLATTLRLDPM
jgi:hypothetical protein